MPSQPLSGVRVVDLTRLLPGAYCTLVLADLGADVVKVEEPRGGDLVRGIPPYLDGTSVYFHALNRNKRCVTLDLRATEARLALDRLIARADVVVESFRPQTARRLRVSAQDVMVQHPRIVHCSLTGFGQRGPYAERPAHDLNFVALAGLFEVDQPHAFGPRRRDQRPRDQRPHDQRPIRVPGLLVADIGGAWAAIAGITSALFYRERTGRGSSVDISIHDVAASWLTFPAAARMMGAGRDVAPSGQAGGGDSTFPIVDDEACYNIYTTGDGRHVALAAIEQKFWRLFCERIGQADLVSQQFVPGVQEPVRERVAEVFRSRTLAEWLALFADTDVCLTGVNSIREALADEHLAARGTVVERDGSTYLRSPLVFRAAAGPKLEESTPRTAIVPARALGADTDDVLREAGMPEDELQALRSSGSI
jgi:alpha-methylacyl-CoA racemase